MYKCTIFKEFAVEIHIKQGENISLAIQKELINQGAQKKDFNASIWNQILNLVDEQNEQSKAGGEAIYQGGNTRKPANWQKNYKVFAGQVLKFSEGIWNRMKAVVGLKPDTLQASNQQALTGGLAAPASPFTTTQMQPEDAINTIPTPEKQVEADENPSQPAQSKTASAPSPLPFGLGNQTPTPAASPFGFAINPSTPDFMPLELDVNDEVARPEDETIPEQLDDTNIEGDEYSNPQTRQNPGLNATFAKALAPQAPTSGAVQADTISMPESDNTINPVLLDIVVDDELEKPEAETIPAELPAQENKASNTIKPKMLAEGAVVQEDGTIVLGEYSYFIDENGRETIKTKNGEVKPTSAIGREVIDNIRAKIHGLTPSSHMGLYRGNDGNYYRWNDTKHEYVQQEVSTPETRAQKMEAEKVQQARFEKFKASQANGVLESFSQEGKGDCWLISSLKALNNSEAGRAALKDCISADEQGNVTVNLKGVGKTYTVTAEEINQAIDSENSAHGDKDAVAIEIAFEKYIKEGIDNNTTNYNENSLNKKRMTYDDDYLYGGRPKVAIETLTGKSVSTISRNSRDSNITIHDNTANLQKMSEETLKPYMDNPNNIIVISLDGADERRQDLAHGLAFKSYDNDFVYLEDTYLNDDGSAKIVKIPKDEFYSRLIEFTYTELNSPMDTKSANAYNTPKPVISKEVEEYLKQKEAESTGS